MGAVKIYIAGKITGDPDYQKKFRIVQRGLEEDGYIVLSPAVLPFGMSPADYMKICFAMIDVADKVYFMPDFRRSGGANLEREYCDYTKKPVCYLSIRQMQYFEQIYGARREYGEDSG